MTEENSTYFYEHLDQLAGDFKKRTGEDALLFAEDTADPHGVIVVGTTTIEFMDYYDDEWLAYSSIHLQSFDDFARARRLEDKPWYSKKG